MNNIGTARTLTVQEGLGRAASEQPTNRLAERFTRSIAPNIREEGDHWIWTGHLQNGAPTLKRHSLQVKRIVFAVFRADPGDRSLRTTCGIRLCVHPRHLERSQYPKGGGYRPLRRFDLTPVTSPQIIAELIADLHATINRLRQLDIDPTEVVGRLVASPGRLR